MFAFHMHWESSPVSPDELNALFMWLWHSVTLFSFFIQISFAGRPCKSGTHLSVIYAQAAILIKHAWRLCFLCTNPKRYKNSSEWQGKNIGYNQTGPVVDTVIFLFLHDDRTKRRVTIDRKRIPSIQPKWFLSLKDWPDTMYQSSIRRCFSPVSCILTIVCLA